MFGNMVVIRDVKRAVLVPNSMERFYGLGRLFIFDGSVQLLG